MTTHLATTHLEANLHAMAAASPDAVARIRGAAPRPDLVFIDTDDGVPTAQIGEGREARLLASRRRPLDEAVKLLGPIDVKDAAVYVVAGFGMGYHVAELTRRLGRTGLVIVYEPDVALLRSVLDRMDCTSWMRAGNVCILTDPEDSAAMGEALRGLEGLVGLGVTLLQHPASAPRLGAGTQRFNEEFTGIVDAVKMTVITTLVHVRVTMRNLFQNADVYATHGGIAELAGVLRGKPAIVVSAGPSLQRNIALLEDPAVRERCVIVAVQTVLKPLLARGIRPHFVTALDYSEINRRFYEGLTAAQVEGITLVVEPKVNPSVLMAWPGRVLCTGDATLDLLLGEKLVGGRPHGTIRQGATVAHLAYYLARHMGCDPVALIGQDLGFTDGQYYASGAAIHTIWAPEVNEFKSLELFEWQRIVRMGPHLRRVRDVLGREMFTDSQMHSYLSQFETDFREDAARGLRTIDATEGGVHKQCTTPLTLREFLATHAAGSEGTSVEETLAAALAASPTVEGPRRATVLRDLRRRLADVRGQLIAVAGHSARTATSLAEMNEHRDDKQRVDRLITKVQGIARDVEKLAPAFGLTQLLAQGTVFNRVRADRMIQLDEGLDAPARQGLQIQRDIENVRGLKRAADELGGMLEDAMKVLDGGARITRDMPKYEQDLERESRAARDGHPVTAAVTRAMVVHALVPVDLHRGGLGWERSLAGACGAHASVLAATVERLLACREIGEIVLAAEDVEGVRALLEPEHIAGGRIRIERPGIARDKRRRRAVAAGRLWARSCWRGGLGDLTVFDEVFEPRAATEIMTRLGMDAALVVGPDWCAVDAALCDDIIRRYRENPGTNRVTFSQAAPGLCGCVMARDLAADLCRTADAAKVVHASIGGVLGYVPGAPVQDLIAHPLCAPIIGAARDCGLRLIADTPCMRQILATITEGESAEDVAKRAQASLTAPNSVEEVVIGRDGVDLVAAVRSCGAAAHVVVTLGTDAWDPMLSGNVPAMVELARGAGAVGVHVRTRLRDATDDMISSLLASGVDVISVDCFDEEHGLAGSRPVLERLLSLRAQVLGDAGMGVPWIVPRLARRDATYELVEEFINEWVIRCGWAALDGPAAARPGERIGPLALPASAAARLARSRRLA